VDTFTMPVGPYEPCDEYVEDLTDDELPVCARCGDLADAHDVAPSTVVPLRPAVTRVRRAS
jgi:hypothetical protein